MPGEHPRPRRCSCPYPPASPFTLRPLSYHHHAPNQPPRRRSSTAACSPLQRRRLRVASSPPPRARPGTTRNPCPAAARAPGTSPHSTLGSPHLLWNFGVLRKKGRRKPAPFLPVNPEVPRNARAEWAEWAFWAGVGGRLAPPACGRGQVPGLQLWPPPASGPEPGHIGHAIGDGGDGSASSRTRYVGIWQTLTAGVPTVDGNVVRPHRAVGDTGQGRAGQRGAGQGRAGRGARSGWLWRRRTGIEPADDAARRPLVLKTRGATRHPDASESTLLTCAGAAALTLAGAAVLTRWPLPHTRTIDLKMR